MRLPAALVNALPSARDSRHTRPMQNPIIVALDVPNAEQAIALAEEVAPAVGAFKIGSEQIGRASCRERV